MNQIALEKFYEALGRVKGPGWRVYPHGFIRHIDAMDYCRCPLELADSMHRNFALAAELEFGFSEGEMSQIVDSADNFTPSLHFDPAIRARMLEILQLKEIE